MSYFMHHHQSAARVSAIRQRGFSLIEFMVASAISMIVLLAAGSTYFTTWQLKQQTQAKVSYQQDMREAGNLIRRDLRQAGDFGCLNAPDPGIIIGLFNVNMYIGQTFDGRHYIMKLKGSPIPNITLRSSNHAPLMIIYGNREAQSSTACGNNTKKENIVAVLYLVGRTQFDTHNHLYRVVWEWNKSTGTGQWGAMQMVAEYVDDMINQFQYQYTDNQTELPNCPKKKSDPNIQIKLTDKKPYFDTCTFSDNNACAVKKIDQNGIPLSPVLTETELKPYYLDDKGKVQFLPSYFINTMIPKGNVCLGQNLDADN